MMGPSLVSTCRKNNKNERVRYARSGDLSCTADSKISQSDAPLGVGSASPGPKRVLFRDRIHICKSQGPHVTGAGAGPARWDRKPGFRALGPESGVKVSTVK